MDSQFSFVPRKTEKQFECIEKKVLMQMGTEQALVLNSLMRYCPLEKWFSED